MSSQPGTELKRGTSELMILAAIETRVEAEFAAGWHADAVAELQQLLAANKEHPGMVTTGDLRRGRSHYVYGQRECGRCGGPVRHEQQGQPGHERVRFWCPACQR